MTTSFSSPGNVNSDGFVFRAVNYHQPEEAHSFINFKGACSGYDNLIHDTNESSLLSFDQNENALQNTYLKGSSSNKDDHNSMWDQDNLDQSYQWNHQMNTKSSLNVDEFSCFETASNFDSMTTTENHGDWLYSEAAAVIANSTIQESGSPEKAGPKRLNTVLLFSFINPLFI